MGIKQNLRRDGTVKPRNWVARSLVVHKAAVHGKSKSSLRRSAKERLRKELRASDE